MQPALPLSGLTIVEIGHSVAAPFGGMILAELGAEVIKVENPGTGDDARLWGPPFVEGSSALFRTLNRNKRSAAVNLRDAEQVAALRAFILEKADAVIQNMRPGKVDEFGLDGRTLRAHNPALIYCNMGAYGPVGPLSRRPGYDPLMQAFGGIMSITGEEGREPVRVSPSIVDQGTGMWAVIAILSALHRRTATGEGCEIDTNLFETAVTWVAPHMANYLASGQVPRRLGSENPGICPYKAYRASDGWLVIAAGNDALFRGVCRALDRPAWLDEPEFASNPKRVENRDRLNGLIAEVVAGADRATWLDRLDAQGVPAAPVQTIDQVVAHPQMAASGILQEPPEGSFPTPGLPVRFDGTRPPYRRTPPALGADTGVIAGRHPKNAAE